VVAVGRRATPGHVPGVRHLRRRSWTCQGDVGGPTYEMAPSGLTAVDFIFMLTRHDRTVEDAAELVDTGVRPWVCATSASRTSGPTVDTMRAIVRQVRAHRGITYLEVVSTTPDSHPPVAFAGARPRRRPRARRAPTSPPHGRCWEASIATFRFPASQPVTPLRSAARRRRSRTTASAPIARRVRRRGPARLSRDRVRPAGPRARGAGGDAAGMLIVAGSVNSVEQDRRLAGLRRRCVHRLDRRCSRARSRRPKAHCARR
jgi:hypothetical protein